MRNVLRRRNEHCKSHIYKHLFEMGKDRDQMNEKEKIDEGGLQKLCDKFGEHFEKYVIFGVRAKSPSAFLGYVEGSNDIEALGIIEYGKAKIISGMKGVK